MAQTWVSLVPPLLTILAAILSKRIVPSLLLGVLAGSLILTRGLVRGAVRAADYLAGSLSSQGRAYIVLFLFMFGALAEIFSLSGGIKGFAQALL